MSIEIALLISIVSVCFSVFFGLKNNKRSDTKDIEERVKEAMKLVGLSEKLKDKSPFELSGGQKRRTAIAGVLAMNPEVLILDEPLAGLDENTQEMLIDFLKKFHASGKTLIIITHNNQLAKELGTRFIKMNEDHELAI